MREIKFRGRHLRLPTLLGDWIYGSLFADGADVHEPMIIATEGEGRYYPVAPATVGQFTGLKDADGREIYEGDVVRFELPPMVLTNEKTAVGAVVYEYGQFLVIIHAMRFTIFSVINDCAVIGNVHDNPELLR